MSENLKPGVWGKMQNQTPEAILSKKQEKEPFPEFATRFHDQAEKALNNMLLVGSIQTRVREIDAAYMNAMSGGDDGTLEKICTEIARQNPRAFPDSLDDTKDSKERAAYVLAVANQMSTQTTTIH